MERARAGTPLAGPGRRVRLIGAVVGVLLMAGCGPLNPLNALSGEDDAAPPAPAASAPPPEPVVNLGPAPTGGATGNLAQRASTGTSVGRRVGQFQRDLGDLQSSIADHRDRLRGIRGEATRNAQEYFGIVAAINARLQVGTTPGNPILVSQLSEAQVQLEDLSGVVSRLTNLANAVASDSSLASFLLESVRATYSLSGAVDEDHRQLSIVEDEVNRTLVEIDRLLTEISDDITRQTNTLSFERNNLRTLQTAVGSGDILGSNLTNRAFTSAVPVAQTTRAATPPRDIGPRSGDRPLVIIRFTNPNVAFEQQLAQAVGQALEARPNTVFDIVSISPSDGNPADQAIAANRARGHAEDVLRSLVNFGVQPSRLTVSANQSADASGPEVRVFVR